MLPNPADPYPDDSVPSVNLYVPSEWNGSKLFRDACPPWFAELKKAGFDHIQNHADWDDDYPIAKIVPWLMDGSFDEANLMDRIAAEVNRVFELEPQITQTVRDALVQYPVKSRDNQPAETKSR